MSAKQPLSATELIEALLRLGLAVNKTTVYRELEKLLKKNEISEVDFGEGQKRYELTHGDHHHHAVCTECRAVVELEIEGRLGDILSMVTKQSGFRIEKHLIEFFGVCEACQS